MTSINVPNLKTPKEVTGYFQFNDQFTINQLTYKLYQNSHRKEFLEQIQESQLIQEIIIFDDKNVFNRYLLSEDDNSINYIEINKNDEIIYQDYNAKVINILHKDFNIKLNDAEQNLILQNTQIRSTFNIIFLLQNLNFELYDLNGQKINRKHLINWMRIILLNDIYYNLY